MISIEPKFKDCPARLRQLVEIVELNRGALQAYVKSKRGAALETSPVLVGIRESQGPDRYRPRRAKRSEARTGDSKIR